MEQLIYRNDINITPSDLAKIMSIVKPNVQIFQATFNPILKFIGNQTENKP